MQAAKVPLNEYEFPASKLANVQSQLERLVGKNYYLHQSARDAYRSYLLAYNSHQLKTIFNVHRLDLLAVARSFGFSAPPKVLALPLCLRRPLRARLVAIGVGTKRLRIVCGMVASWWLFYVLSCMCGLYSQVSLNLESKASKARQKPGTADYRRKSGHAFSASNPYGVKGAGDNRQFVRV